MLEELLASLNKTTTLIIAQLSESGQPIRHRFFWPIRPLEGHAIVQNPQSAWPNPPSDAP